MRKKTLVGLAVLAAVGAAAGVLLTQNAPAPVRTAAQAPAGADTASAATAGRFAALPPREGLSQPQGDVLGVRSAPVPRAAAQAPVRAAPQAAPAAPAAPAMPYRVAGQLVHDGVPQVVLARDNRVIVVRVGEVLEGGYLVESVGPEGVTLVYTELGIRETLAFSPVLPAPRALAAAPAAIEPRAAPGQPARLRWEGPEQVQAGRNFDVALKITSSQQLRGSPVQLSFDAKLLEPVAVRAGDFFADGSFSFRVNPTGSIFVGTSGKSIAAEDAEFLVVTFKPIRSGGVAELRVSSLALQGAAGGAVVHEPIAAFRTSITQ